MIEKVEAKMEPRCTRHEGCSEITVVLHSNMFV